MRRLARSAVVLAVLLLAPRLADACSCVAASPCRQFGNADAVFAGEILEVTGGESQTGPPGRKRARLRVARAYKGAVQAGQVVAVEMPAGSSASCSLDLSPGDRFVMFAEADGGRFTTHLCSGSYALGPSAPWPSLPPASGVVSGRVLRQPSDLDRRVGRLDGFGVAIVTPTRRITATTDAEGRFRLAEVPAGTWTVTFTLGDGVRREEIVELQSAEDCAELLVEVPPRRE